MGFFSLMDPVWWFLVGPTILLSLWAQYKVKSAYNKWSRRSTRSGMSGAQAAADMLSREGLNDVRIEMVDGFLSDHYDPSKRVLRLSPGVYKSNSIAAVGIACHEAGHALQHARGYAFLGLRSVLVPTASLGSWMAIPLIIIGFIFSSLMLVKIGIVFFGVVVAFQLITLPVEFNASSRAKEALQRNMVLSNGDEVQGVNEVLNAAAMTYVAAALSAVAQLIYLIILGNRRD